MGYSETSVPFAFKNNDRPAVRLFGVDAATIMAKGTAGKSLADLRCSACTC